MCGIAGIASYKKDKLKHINSMLNAIRHRGPDDEGLVFFAKENQYLFGGKDTPSDVFQSNFNYSPSEELNYAVPDGSFAVLGHRRLSIIDLSSAAHQPMCDKTKNFWIIFNGEIYNYIELRQELLSMGCTFYTNTDTEVALNAYKLWGSDCLKKFNGMWSFVIYDKNKNILFGSRDRFGVKPFYYYIDKYTFAFASEIKALTALPFIEKKINPSAVFDYLIFGLMENEEEGFFHHIIELPPSFAFEYSFSDRCFKKWRYYTLTYSEKRENFNDKKFAEYSEEIKNLIFNAVKLRLRSDVPVGSCLSGGVDSSSIVCVISNLVKKETLPQVGKKQKTFTACYDSKDMDETRWAKLAATSSDALWFQVFPQKDDFLNDLEDLIYTQDIPFISTSMYAQYRVMNLAKQNNIKVLLDGQGADELFTGYHAYYRAFFNEMLKRLSLSTFIKEFQSLNNASLAKGAVLKSVIKDLFPFIFKKTIPINSFINKDFLKENNNRLNLHKEKAARSLNKMLFESMTSGNLKNLLRYEDRNSMRFSIETRTPFADDINLIKYVFDTPGSYKIHNGFSKFLLRESMKNVIPDKIRLRTDKIGFATPEREWLNGIKNNLKHYITGDLEHFINLDYALNNWDKLFAEEIKAVPNSLWRLINFAVWKKVYCL